MSNLVDEVTNLVNLAQKVEFLEESLSAQQILALDDKGWSNFGVGNPEEDGPSLHDLHALSKLLSEYTSTSPMFKRGAQLRHAYVFGRGMQFSNTQKRTETIMANPYNKSALFSVNAHAVVNMALFTDGNVFITRDMTTNILSVIPLRQITAVRRDPDDSTKIQYLQRTWTVDDKEYKRWYPLARYRNTKFGRGKTGGKLLKTITVDGKPIPVSQDTVIYHHATNQQPGWTFGIPDSLAGYIHTLAYSGYLKDNTVLVKALSQFAWKVTNPTTSGAKSAAVQVAQSGTGGTAVLGSGNDLASAGVPSAQVDFNKGQPLIAQVAASFGVPVIALISSPGATGGSYGAASTLDEPTLKGMKATQDSWKILFEEILYDMGSPDAVTGFPNISQDATYREAATLVLGMTSGAIDQAELRAAYAELVDVQLLSETLPKPSLFNDAAKALLAKQQAEDNQAAADAAAAQNDTGTSAQGKTGAVPGGQNQGQTDHSSEKE